MIGVSFRYWRQQNYNELQEFASVIEGANGLPWNRPQESEEGSVDSSFWISSVGSVSSSIQRRMPSNMAAFLSRLRQNRLSD